MSALRPARFFFNQKITFLMAAYRRDNASGAGIRVGFDLRFQVQSTPARVAFGERQVAVLNQI